MSWFNPYIRHPNHLYGLLFAAMFADYSVFFNNLCTIRALFGIPFGYDRWKHRNNNNKQREKGA